MLAKAVSLHTGSAFSPTRRTARAPISARAGVSRARPEPFRPSDELISFFLLVAAFAVIHVLIGGTRLIYSLPAYGLLGAPFYLNEFYKFHVNQWQAGAEPASEEEMR